MVSKVSRLIAEGLQLHRDGFIDERQVARDFIKFIAGYGDQKDFDSLPLWVQEEMSRRIEEYKIIRSWTVLTSEGVRDMAEAAELFIRRISL